MERGFGIDTSSRSALTYTRQPNHTVAAVIVSDGDYVLRDYEALLTEAGKADVTIAMHYARSSVLADKQLDTFFQAIHGFKVDGYSLDLEKKNNSKSSGFSEAAEYMMQEMTVMGPSLLYSGRYMIQDWIYPYSHWPKNYPLWIAQYPYNEVTMGSQWPILKNVVTNVSWQPVLPAGITDWKLWQFSADGNMRASREGITGNNDVDLNVFNGTIEEMKTWFKIDSVPPLPPDCSQEVLDEVREQTIQECIVALEEM